MIYTFYSYKGGVGRSMAMANIAWELASRGLRVLAIDFDLEAPGLERYFAVPVADVHASKGVVDLIDAFKRALSGSGSMADDAEFRQLPQFIRRGVADFGRRGRLDLMPAGRRASEDDRRAYALAVRTFDWQDFYFNWEGEAFFEWLRRALVGPGDEQYDVVLADSRTGVTEMGGVCACQLADVVVMLSAPNHQNLDGTRELAADLNSPEVQRLRRNRPPLSIVVVPARVEQRLPEARADFERRFDEAFAALRPPLHAELGISADDLALPYVPEFAFEEQVTNRPVDGGQALTERYRHLADALLVLAGDSVPADLREAARRALRPETAAGPGPEAQAAPAFDPSRRSAGVDAYLSCPRGSRSLLLDLLAALERTGARFRTEFGEAEAFGADRDLPLTTAEQLGHAEVLVLCADAQGISPWQRAELKLARGLPRPPAIVRLLLPGAVDDAFELAFGQTLRDCTLIDLRRWPAERSGVLLLAEALARGAAGAEQTQASPKSAPLQPPGTVEGSPFPGSGAYGEGDAAVFGGRRAAIESLRALAVSQRRLLLVGPSGAGKTSLVMAGLFPALRGGRDPAVLEALNLRGAVAADERWRAAWQRALQLGADALLVLDHADEADDEVLQAVLQAWQRADGPRLLLVWRAAPLAQAESQALHGWRVAGRAAATQPGDRLHHACRFGDAAEALMAAVATAPRVELAALDAESLRAAVEAALAYSGRRAEPGLLERLFTDAGPQPSAAAVQRLLRQLWRQQQRGWLTNDAYDRVGGIDGHFIAELERRLGSVPAAERDGLNALLLRLLRRAEDGAIVLHPFSWARSVAMPVFAGRAAALVQRLAAVGILQVQRQGDDVLVAIAHRPRDWAGLDPLRQAAARWLAPSLQVAAAYAGWVGGGADDDADTLIEAQDLAELAPYLSAGEAAFAAWRQAQAQRDHRIKRYARIGVLAVVAVLIAMSLLQQRIASQAEQAAKEAEQAQRSAAVTAARALTEVAAAYAPTAAQAAPTTAAPPPPPTAPARVTVVAHRSGDGAADARLAATLLQRLAASGFTLGGEAEAVVQRVCGDVRYFADADRAAAQRAQELLNAALADGGDLRRLALNDRSQSRAAAAARAGTIEVWLPPLSDAPAARDDRWGPSRLVAGGCALLGSDLQTRDALRRGLSARNEDYYASEKPLRRTWVGAFYIGATEVTMTAFAAYQRECQGRQPACPPWNPRFVDAQKDPRRPATFVSWAQARDYCRWAGGRLPTDAEWEKAARGTDGRFWPWGDQPDESRFQGFAAKPDRPVDVGSFPAGNSPYGVADLAGNVWEYTADPWQEPQGGHAMRGGSYLNSLMQSRASVRWASSREADGTENLGFRCVADLK
ncbi:MAG: SUMF1/EgtB/PvdO family nonheme iron enzyme [Proteobacteria bacterium]|nr:SUMF1/EgtB/PvdO family nonheme iron enzyme [Pseudomonadota bacterium]